MPLQTSGAISLNQIHVEAGGSSGTQASINDSDIRALIGKASGATSSFSNFYGASANWTSTITIGAFTILKNTSYGYNQALYGAMSDTTIDTWGNRTIYSLAWGGTYLTLLVIGNQPNSGWTRIKVHNTNFYRSSATFGYSTYSTWQWATTTNPFGATSGTRTITFVI